MTGGPKVGGRGLSLAACLPAWTETHTQTVMMMISFSLLIFNLLSCPSAQRPRYGLLSVCALVSVYVPVVRLFTCVCARSGPAGRRMSLPGFEGS